MKYLTKNQQIAVTVAVVAIVALIFFGNALIELFSSTPDVVEKEGILQDSSMTGQTGQVAESGMAVAVHYTGTLQNGTKFDSSYDRGEPIVFVLGKGQVIPGWEKEILGMKVGDKKRFVVPPELGYGDQQVGPIPPNSTLIFEVELVAVQKVQ